MNVEDIRTIVKNLEATDAADNMCLGCDSTGLQLYLQATPQGFFVALCEGCWDQLMQMILTRDPYANRTLAPWN